jgi:transposase
MTTLTDPEQPFVLSNFRVGSNTAQDFLRWVVTLIAQRHLVAGDVLICDNASVHVAREIIDPLNAALDAAHVRLVLLPTYSPELNPCELVFAQVKSHLRRKRTENPFWIEIINAFTEVTITNMLLYYLKCHRI